VKLLLNNFKRKFYKINGTTSSFFVTQKVKRSTPLKWPSCIKNYLCSIVCLTRENVKNLSPNCFVFDFRMKIFFIKKKKIQVTANKCSISLILNINMYLYNTIDNFYTSLLTSFRLIALGKQFSKYFNPIFLKSDYRNPSYIVVLLINYLFDIKYIMILFIYSIN